MQSTFIRLVTVSAMIVSSILSACPAVDVAVYGATPAGIAAALAAADNGEDVILIEPTHRIGGLTASGLSHTDFRTFEGVTGVYLDLARRIEAYYQVTYGPDSEQAAQCFRGTHAEPSVYLKIFRQMIAERPSIRLVHEWTLASVRISDAKRIEFALFNDADGEEHLAAAEIFIDATYEGDLMAMAGVPYRYGRESRAEYGEPLAPETADKQVQGYNFRLTMTQVEANRVDVKMPKGYSREQFAGVLPLFEDGRLEGVFGYSPPRYIYKDQIPPLPNGKVDINDVSRSAVRLSMPSINNDWPDGDAETRQRLFDEHVLWNIGLLYFLQTDPEVPEEIQAEALSWGWCRDEFVDSDHLPPQLYVREARRMQGMHVFTQSDTDYAEGDARAVFKADSIAMCDYGLNCHGTGREGTRFDGRHTGEFYQSVAPYQIPYGVIVPNDVSNLLVPVAASASHVGFCALRFEPLWAGLGQAAGHAAHLAIETEAAVQSVSARRLQRLLHHDGAATIYVSDVLPGHPDFVMVQTWGALGGLHGLYSQPEQPGQRGEHIVGQYFEAYPGQAVELERTLDRPTFERWRTVAYQNGLDSSDLPTPDASMTRGDWLRAVVPLLSDLD